MSTKPRRSKGKGPAPSRPRARPAPHASRRRLRIGLALFGALGLPLLVLWIWARLPGPGSGRVLGFELGALTDVPGSLERSGVISSPRLFSLYARLLRPTTSWVPGVHVLSDRLSPSEVVDRLGRARSRPKVKVVLVEGFTQAQVLARLEKNEVISQQGLRLEPELRRELGLSGASLEGYWSPATWELYVDSDPKELMRLMVSSTRKRLERVSARHPGALGELKKTRGWGEHEILTLASIIEKETPHADERPLVASVYLNRLDDPSFVPRGRLQADPTAAYPCQSPTSTGKPPSCTDFDKAGKVTPRMLRDPDNPYNTYLRAGLPPGPIASPSEAAIEAVIAPAKTEYLFFVANGKGRHTFSRTFAEHNDAINKPR